MNEPGRQLIITNGDSAAATMTAAGLGEVVSSGQPIPDECANVILPWRDVLHEGPVPFVSSLSELAEHRIAFLESKGMGADGTTRSDFERRNTIVEDNGSFDRVVLWFEHDLYDQLQLIEVLSWFAEHPRVDQTLWLVQCDGYLGEFSPEQIGQWQTLAKPVNASQLAIAREAWQAVRQPTPEAWAALVGQDLSPLPFLAGAIVRMLEELPDTRSGLRRTERHIVTLIRSGIQRPAHLFRDYQVLEEARFLGDWWFFDRIAQMARCSSPLLDGLEAARSEQIWRDGEDHNRFLNSTLRLTVIGNEVLAGREDYFSHNSIDRWWGGTHLSNDNDWRWDAKNARLIPPQRT